MSFKSFAAVCDCSGVGCKLKRSKHVIRLAYCSLRRPRFIPLCTELFAVLRPSKNPRAFAHFNARFNAYSKLFCPQIKRFNAKPSAKLSEINIARFRQRSLELRFAVHAHAVKLVTRVKHKAPAAEDSLARGNFALYKPRNGHKRHVNRARSISAKKSPVQKRQGLVGCQRRIIKFIFQNMK